MSLTAVVAIARNGVIGLNNTMPWHLPEDLRRFKRLTTGHPVLMGRKTYDSIVSQLGRPLPGRPHWVISRQADWAPAPEHALQVQVAGSLAEAMAAAASAHPDQTLILVGGAQIYQQALADDLLETIELTLVAAEPDGDAFFPLETLRDPERWTWTRAEDSPANEACEFWRLRRVLA